jgi:hypothetical protein
MTDPCIYKKKCRVSFQKWNKFSTLVHVVGFTTGIILRCITLWTSNSYSDVTADVFVSCPNFRAVGMRKWLVQGRLNLLVALLLFINQAIVSQLCLRKCLWYDVASLLISFLINTVPRSVWNFFLFTYRGELTNAVSFSHRNWWILCKLENMAHRVTCIPWDRMDL